METDVIEVISETRKEEIITSLKKKLELTTQREFGNSIGINQTYISLALHNEPTCPTRVWQRLKKYFNFFGTAVEFNIAYPSEKIKEEKPVMPTNPETEHLNETIDRINETIDSEGHVKLPPDEDKIAQRDKPLTFLTSGKPRKEREKRGQYHTNWNKLAKVIVRLEEVVFALKEVKNHVFGEYQLCPKCRGAKTFKIEEYTQDHTAVSLVINCDICQGTGIIQKPVINS